MIAAAEYEEDLGWARGGGKDAARERRQEMLAKHMVSALSWLTRSRKYSTAGGTKLAEAQLFTKDQWGEEFPLNRKGRRKLWATTRANKPDRRNWPRKDRANA